MVIEDERPTEATPGTCRSRFATLSNARAAWNRKNERLDLLRPTEARIDPHQRQDGPDHQPGDDQQRQRQRDLTHDQHMARALPRGRIAGR
jgi:hypothetical protein